MVVQAKIKVEPNFAILVTQKPAWRIHLTPKISLSPRILLYYRRVQSLWITKDLISSFQLNLLTGGTGWAMYLNYAFFFLVCLCMSKWPFHISFPINQVARWTDRDIWILKIAAQTNLILPVSISFWRSPLFLKKSTILCLHEFPFGFTLNPLIVQNVLGPQRNDGVIKKRLRRLYNFLVRPLTTLKYNLLLVLRD